MCDMCVYFVLNIQRLWLIYPIRLVIYFRFLEFDEDSNKEGNSIQKNLI